MVDIRKGAIEEAVDAFMGRESKRPFRERRERSWDVCFGYFQQTNDLTKNIELSSLHLMAYLCSWGMYRGSTWIFKNTNVRHLERAIEVIENFSMLKGWDVEDYDDDAQYQAYEEAWEELKVALLPEGNAATTLVSKTMMGVWGCIPSLDTYFLQTFKDLSTTRQERGQWVKGGREAFAAYQEIYREHRDEIEQVRRRYPIMSRENEPIEGLLMPQAKVIDTYGFYTSWNKRE